MPRLHVRARVAVIAVSAATASVPAVAQHPAADRTTLVTTLGRDTVALESYSSSPTRVEGDIAVRVPGTVLCHYVITYASDGSPRQSHVEIRPLAAPGVDPATVTLDFTGDSVHVVSESQGKKQTATRAAKDVSPFFLTGFGASYGLYTAAGPLEAYLSHHSSASTDTVAVPAIDVATARVGRRRFVRRSPTDVDADWFGYFWQHLTVDAANRISAIDSRGTTEKTMTERATSPIDVSAAAQRFAQADRSGHGLGAASTDTVARGTVNGKLVVVTYGSPRARGRTILGAVVPYDRVWRTGANAATVLVTDAALTVGGTSLAAGAYSLWTIPKQDGSVTLVINRQHGQWGTDYDPSQDVARIPMQTSTAATPQDRFTIDVGGSGTPRLRMAWGTFVWSVPLE